MTPNLDGSMLGSGIYGDTITTNITCKNSACEAELGDQSVDTNDYGGYSFTCPKCNYESDYAGEPYGTEYDKDDE